MVVAALVIFALLLTAWLLAPGDSARANVEPISIQPEPSTAAVRAAA